MTYLKRVVCAKFDIYVYAFVMWNIKPKLFKKKDYSRKLIFYYEMVIQKQTY